MLDIFRTHTKDKLKSCYSKRGLKSSSSMGKLGNSCCHAVSPSTQDLLNENLQFSKTPGGAHAHQSPGPGASISGHVLSTALVRGQLGEYNKLFTPESVA